MPLTPIRPSRIEDPAAMTFRAFSSEVEAGSRQESAKAPLRFIRSGKGSRRCDRPFCRTTWLAMTAAAGLVLMTPAAITPARAQANQQAAFSGQAKSDSAKSDDPNSDGVRPAAAVTDKPE